MLLVVDELLYVIGKHAAFESFKSTNNNVIIIITLFLAKQVQ